MHWPGMLLKVKNSSVDFTRITMALLILANSAINVSELLNRTEGSPLIAPVTLNNGVKVIKSPNKVFMPRIAGRGSGDILLQVSNGGFKIPL